MKSRIVVFLALCLAAVSSFRYGKWFGVFKYAPNQNVKASNQPDFDAIETEKALREIAGNMGKTVKRQRDPIIDVAVEGKAEVSPIGEETYRKYPSADLGLPLLPDHNNYYSGKFRDSFWHQNADQVLVFIPLDDSVSNSDIKATFEATKLSVTVKGETIVAVRCFERIIPDGSFWIIEKDKNGKRYIQLDLEKRYRMLNWRAFFGPPPDINDDPVAAQSRSKLMESLMSANKGLSKLTGVPAETMDEMMKNPDFLDAMSRPADLETKMTIKDSNGQTISLSDLGFDEFRRKEPLTLAELDTNDPNFPYKSQDEDDKKKKEDEDDNDDYLEEEDDEDEDEGDVASSGVSQK